MNNIFKVIWNHSTQSWVAVSELQKAKGKTRSVKTAASLLAGGLLISTAYAAETVPTASINQNANGKFTAGVGASSSYATVTNIVTSLNNTGFFLGLDGNGGKTEEVLGSDTKISNGDTFILTAGENIGIRRIDNGYEIHGTAAPTTTLIHNGATTQPFSTQAGEQDYFVTATNLAGALNTSGFNLKANAAGGTFTNNASDKRIANGDTFVLTAGDNVSVDGIDNGFRVIVKGEGKLTANASGAIDTPAQSKRSLLMDSLSISEAINASGFNVTVGTGVDGGNVTGKSTELVNPGETVTFDAGKNMKLVQEKGKFTYATKDEVDFTSVTVGNAGSKITINNSGINMNNKPITNINNGLVNGSNGLLNLAGSTVQNGTAATVGDLRNMGWVVSSNKTTGAVGVATDTVFKEAVKNAGQVEFVGTGAAKVSGSLVDGKNVITVHVDSTATSTATTPATTTAAELPNTYFHTNNNTTTQGKGNALTNEGKVDDIAGAGAKFATTAGVNAVVKGETSVNSIAIGYGANIQAATTKNNGTVVGSSNSIAMGTDATIKGQKSVAIGYNTSIQAPEDNETSGVAIGDTAKVDAKNSIAIGHKALAEATAQGSAMAIGDQAKATGQYTVAVGTTAEAKGYGATAIAYKAVAETQNAIALGADATAGKANGYAEIAIGNRAKAEGNRALAMGLDAKSQGASAIAIGQLTETLEKASQSTAIGYSAKTELARALALGNKANAKGVDSTAIGTSSVANGTSGFAIGSKANSTGTNSFAVGTSATTTAANTLAIGTESKANTAFGVAMGYQAQAGETATAGYRSTAIGHTAKALANDTIAIGTNAQATDVTAISIGRNTTNAGSGSVAIGDTVKISETADRTVVLGREIESLTKSDNVILGSRASEYSATINNDSYNENGQIKDPIEEAIVGKITYGGFAGERAAGVVSVGRDKQDHEYGDDLDGERRIINVAAGEISARSTDAINGSQLYSTIKNGSWKLSTKYQDKDKKVHINKVDDINWGEEVEFYSPDNTIAISGIKDQKTGVNTITLDVNRGKVAHTDDGKAELGDSFKLAVDGEGGLLDTFEPVKENDLVTAGSVSETINNTGFKVAGNGEVAKHTEGDKKGKIEIVNPGDTVDFVNGVGTTAKTSVVAGVNTVTYDVNIDNNTIINDNGVLKATAKAPETTELTVNEGKVAKPSETALADGNKFVTADEIATTINEVGFKVADENGGTSDLIKAGDTVTFKNGTGTTASVDTSGNVTYSVNNAAAPTVTDGKAEAPAEGNTYLTAKAVVDTINQSGFIVTKDGNARDNDSLVNAGENLNFKDGTQTTVDVTGNTVTVNVKTATLDNPNSEVANANAGKLTAPTTDGVVTANNLVEAINNTGFKLKTSAATGTTGKKETGTADENGELINPSDTVEMIAGKNLTVKQDTDGKVTFATAAEVAFDKVTVGPVVIGKDAGINAGDTQIKGVKAGTEDTDAVNLSQLKTEVAASKENVVSADGSVKVERKVNADYSTDFDVSVNTDDVTIEKDQATGAIKAKTTNLTTNTDGTAKAGDATSLVTGDQVATAINNAGLSFSGDVAEGTANLFKRKNQEETKIIGGETDKTKLSDKNIGVVSNGTDTLTIKLAKVLTGLTSADFTDAVGNTTKVDGNGITIDPKADGKGNVTLTTAGLDNGGNKITNVAAGVDNTDAVNVSQLNQKAAAAKTEVKGSGLATVAAPTKGAEGQDIYTVDVAKAEAPTVTRGNVTVKAGDEGKVMTAGDVATAITNSEKTSSVKAGSAALTVTPAAEDAKGNTEYTVDLAEDLKKQIAKEESVTAGNNNLTIEQDTTNATGGKNYKVTLSNNLDLGNAGSVKMGDVTTNADGLTINNGTAGKPVSLTKDGLDNGGNKITNVAAGVADTDAVNVGQLNNVVNNSINNSGFTLKTSGNVESSTGDEKINPNDTVEMVAGKNLTVKQEANGKITYATANDVDFNNVTATNSIGITNGPTMNTTGINAAGKKVTGVADGDISPTSTDAVNGSQIYALSGGNINKVDDYTVTNPDGTKTTYQNVVLDENGEPVLVTYNVKTQGEHITNSVITAINNMNSQGIKFFHTNDGKADSTRPSDQRYNSEDSSASGAYATAVGYQSEASGTSSVAMGNNSTAAGENAIAIGVNAQANAKNTISVGNGNIVNGENSGAFGDPSKIDAKNSYSVGNNNELAVGQSDVFALGNEIKETTSNSVFLGSKSGSFEQKGSTRGNNGVHKKTANSNYTYRGENDANVAGVENAVGVVSVGNANETRQIQGVAAGVVSETSTDAINGSQLHYTNKAIGDVKNDINKLGNAINKNNRNLRAGIAGANAAAGLPQVYLPGKSMVAASAGTFKGEGALAVGYSRASDNGKVILKLQGNANTRGEVGGSVGVGYQW
ncbi:YadA-like family protein [Mannheimia indoligenes]|uniref:YadA-like family protein n=1 Tax=Mannheimia indoligenes TaxID=3103145 RepID=UPI002FE690EE